MKRYVLCSYLENEYNAGPKSRQDIINIALEEGYLKVIFRNRNLSGPFKVLRRLYMLMIDLIKIFFYIESHSLLIINAPLPFENKRLPYFAGFFRLLHAMKKIEIVFSVIDLDSLRLIHSRHDREWDILRTGSCFILHTEPMKETFVKKGFDGRKVVLNHLFDYLSKFDSHNKQRILTKEVVFAGNLEKDKCGFLSNLHELTDQVIFNLYGEPAMTQKLSDFVRYKGSAPPDNIINIIEGSFGLVWDGFSLDTCSGAIGEYLRINAPHKTSLYLTAGLPVIIWKEAAMADLIISENLGFAIGSLREIGEILDRMTVESYHQMRDNVLRYAALLRDGYFFKEALKKVYDKI